MRQSGQPRPVIEADAGLPARQGDQTVQRTTIEQPPAKHSCGGAADGALAGSRGTVNGHDRRIVAHAFKPLIL